MLLLLYFFPKTTKYHMPPDKVPQSALMLSCMVHSSNGITVSDSSNPPVHQSSIGSLRVSILVQSTWGAPKIDIFCCQKGRWASFSMEVSTRAVGPQPKGPPTQLDPGTNGSKLEGASENSSHKPSAPISVRKFPTDARNRYEELSSPKPRHRHRRRRPSSGYQYLNSNRLARTFAGRPVNPWKGRKTCPGIEEQGSFPRFHLNAPHRKGFLRVSAKLKLFLFLLQSAVLIEQRSSTQGCRKWPGSKEMMLAHQSTPNPPSPHPAVRPEPL
ncbi:Band 4.1-like protein 2 [Anopheles sinensis]|uniref:Band 4.1-like protein 2 n=1 Tax=Anopheles sinensis TaxID=74873 RepID=A0A084VYI7_ANOSI|nr:Band 4.1-like protein 2 [Anopheles sinensis]